MNELRRSVFAVAMMFLLMGEGRAQDISATAQSGSSQQVASVPVTNRVVRDDYRGPFSTVGVALKIDSLGAGFDVATPLARKLNLRVGANFFDYAQAFNIDGINYNSELHFDSGQASLDWFPMGGGFHISPGVMIYKNDLTASANVPGNNTFTLNDQTYTSSLTNPANGNASLTFPHTVAPSLMIGWGNIVPRSRKHWSVPFELGAAYVGQTSVNINLAGTVCTTQNGSYQCFNAATDPETQTNLKAEENTLNEDLKRIEVYPLVSLGLSYKF